MKKFLLCAATAVVFVSLWCHAEDKKLLAKSFLGKPAPPIIVEKWISAEPDRKVKFVLIDFWAT